MPKSCRLILYISVESFHGVTELQPESSWENPLLRYHIGVHCRNCNLYIMDDDHLPLYLCAANSLTEGEDGNEYHKPLNCPVCMGSGGLRILSLGFREEEVEGLRIMEASRLSKASDSDLSSEDSDADSDD